MIKTMNLHQKRDKGHLSTKRQLELKKKKKYVGKQEHQFVNGGSMEDPLNLKSIPLQCSAENSPAASPSSHYGDRRELIPVLNINFDDPLNLEGAISDKEHKKCLVELRRTVEKGSRKHRHRAKKRDGHDSAPEDLHDSERDRPRSLSLGAKSSGDPIVSPVSTHSSPRKRRRTVSEGASCSDLSGDEGVSATSKRTRLRSGSRHSEQKRPTQQAEPSQAPPDTTTQVRVLPKSAKFQFGNYHRYYGYRNCGQSRDPRLCILSGHKHDFFMRKDVLDIGCNAGHVTLAIARDFKPHKVVGIDIDKQLIDLARKNIRHYVAETKKSDETARFPRSAKLTFGPLVPQHVDGADSEKDVNFPYNVYFAQGNIVLDTDEQVSLQRPEFDTIMALSVTKWIHLNWGDDGLKRAFKRIYNQLRPGGCFILEPQSMASYKRRRNLTERIRQNYDNITLRPEYFPDYLLYEIGFEHCDCLGMSDNPAKGFSRQMYAFYKRKF